MYINGRRKKRSEGVTFSYTKDGPRQFDSGVIYNALYRNEMRRLVLLRAKQRIVAAKLGPGPNCARILF